MNFRTFYEARYAIKRDGRLKRSSSLKRAEHARIERQITEWIQITSQMRIVDIGGGPASYFSQARIVRTDIAAGSFGDAWSGARVQCDATQLPFADGAFDVAVASQVLEHIPDWQRTLREINRVLAPRGALFLAVPNSYALMRRRYHQLQRQIDMSGHIHEFRESQLYFELLQAGFEAIEVHGACYDAFWLGSLLERSTLAKVLIPAMDRIDPRVLEFLIYWDTRLHRRKLNGLSLELICRKSKM